MRRRMGVRGLRDGLRGRSVDDRERASDPLQRRNLWNEPAWQTRKQDLIADLYDNLPPERSPKLDAVASV